MFGSHKMPNTSEFVGKDDPSSNLPPCFAVARCRIISPRRHCMPPSPFDLTTNTASVRAPPPLARRARSNKLFRRLCGAAKPWAGARRRACTHRRKRDGRAFVHVSWPQPTDRRLAFLTKAHLKCLHTRHCCNASLLGVFKPGDLPREGVQHPRPRPPRRHHRACPVPPLPPRFPSENGANSNSAAPSRRRGRRPDVIHVHNH